MNRRLSKYTSCISSLYEIVVMILNYCDNTKEKGMRHKIPSAEHNFIIIWSLWKVIVERSMMCVFSVTVDIWTPLSWATMGHIVVLLIEKVLDYWIVISNSKLYCLFFMIKISKHFRIFIIWRRWWLGSIMKTWWRIRITIHLKEKFFCDNRNIFFGYVTTIMSSSIYRK